MKTKYYVLSYEDKQGNELQRITIEALNKKDAKRIAKIAYANSMLNDLHKIIVL